jgi:penicillin-binding protein 1B
MTRTKKILIGAAAFIFVSAIALAVTMFSLQGMINQRLEKGWVLPPLELYSQGFPLSAGRKMPQAALEAEFERRGLQSGRDYEFSDAESCVRQTGVAFKDTSTNCLYLRKDKLLVAWGEGGWIQEVWRGDPWAEVPFQSLYPRLITQFYDGNPILQFNTPLSDIPLYCLQAVTAIEDRDFLEHRGVSATGTMRAILRNLRAGRFAEGGSTITQQLVKNFFLNSKKTIKRKLQEQLLAVMLESQIGKDQIFEMYLNVIYMGQNGPYQVRGFGSAADYYFDKPISRLDLSECAMLAATINNPGKYSPFHKDGAAAKERRQLVLNRMAAENMISPAEAQTAAAEPLPKPAPAGRKANAPYFVFSALKEFQALDFDAPEGARIYTTLDTEVQTHMVAAVNKVIGAVEKRVKKPSKQPLQVAALTVDLATAQVLALIGGRDFRATQYNRAYASRRQVGSIVKPFVYWPALQDKDHDPLTTVVDEPFEWKVHKQVWKPKNYDGKNHGPVPYFYALAHSMNIPAAKVGQEIGLTAVADAIQNAGISEKVPLLPSLTLGAFELSLWDVAQGYSTLGRMGAGDSIHTVTRVEGHQGEVLYERKSTEGIELPQLPTAVLVGMMRQTIEAGTARAARIWGLAGDYAGKTGTTNDTKDAWMAGFSSRLLTVVWVGYDDNTPMNLTGSSAALPIWTEIAKAEQADFETVPFAWPKGASVRSFSRDELTDKFPSLKDLLPEKVELVFADWAY